jgi:hypothetical protein
MDIQNMITAKHKYSFLEVSKDSFKTEVSFIIINHEQLQKAKDIKAKDKKLAHLIAYVIYLLEC